MRVITTLLAGILLVTTIAGDASGQSNPVQMSFLPQGRSGSPNTPVTVFGTVINSGDEALDCAPQFGGFLGGLPTGTTGQLKFFPWDGSQITGTANQVVNIPAGGRQDYIVEAVFDRAFTGVVSSNFRCTTAGGTNFDAPRRPAVSDLAFNIQSTSHTDIILINDTLTHDGIARVGDTGPRAALMTVAAVNIGDAGTNLVAEAGISGFTSLHNGLDISVCEIDAAGACISASGRTLAIASWATNETRLFAVRARVPEEMGVPFYPDILRLIFLIRPADVSGDKELTGSAEVRLGGFSRFGLDYTGSAIDARPQDRGIPDRLRLNIDMECETDGGVVFTPRIRESHIAVLPQGASGIRLFGGVEVQDFDFDNYDQPISGVVADWRSSELFTGTAHGTGDIDQVGSNSSINFGLNFDPQRSMSIRWSANTGFRNDFQSAGRVRCAAAPAAPDQPAQSGLESAITGTYTLQPAIESGTRLEVGEGVTVILDDGSRVSLDIDIIIPTPEQFSPGLNASFSVVTGGGQNNRELSSSTALNPGDQAGVVVPLRYRSTGQDTAEVDCAVMYLSGLPSTEADPETADEDAGAYTLVREGVNLTADELAECTP